MVSGLFIEQGKRQIDFIDCGRLYLSNLVNKVFLRDSFLMGELEYIVEGHVKWQLTFLPACYRPLNLKSFSTNFVPRRQ